MVSVPVSVLIITYNEEQNIRHALESVVSWAGEVFVIDSYSDDRTVEICRSYSDRGVRVWRHTFEDYSAQRNWALEQLPWSNEWVLVLDADERVSPRLAQELRRLFAAGEPPKDFYYVKRRFIFLGRWLKRCSSYPFWLIRLFRVTEARYVRSVNEQVVVSGEPGYLANDLIHEDQKGLAAWVAKHNRYSSLEAREYLKVQQGMAGADHVAQADDRPDVRTQKHKRIFMRLPLRPWARFFYMYVWKRGFLDGKPGFLYSVLKAIQEFHISCKMYELRLREQQAQSRTGQIAPRRERPHSGAAQ